MYKAAVQRQRSHSVFFVVRPPHTARAIGVAPSCVWGSSPMPHARHFRYGGFRWLTLHWDRME